MHSGIRFPASIFCESSSTIDTDGRAGSGDHGRGRLAEAQCRRSARRCRRAYPGSLLSQDLACEDPLHTAIMCTPDLPPPTSQTVQRPMRATMTRLRRKRRPRTRQRRLPPMLPPLLATAPQVLSSRQLSLQMQRRRPPQSPRAPRLTRLIKRRGKTQPWTLTRL